MANEAGKEKYRGLSDEEAARLAEQYGPNRIVTTKRVTPWKIFLSQFKDPLIIILFLAAMVSWGIGYLPGQESHLIDVILILTIVLISGVAGFFQEYRAEKAIQALQEMATPVSRVVRGGRERQIPTPKVVPGDLIILEGGDMVPADAELIDPMNVKVNEAPMTGESEPVSKKAGDPVYMNTYLNAGNTKAKVVRTGMDTEMGKIAGELEKVEREASPFQKEMANISRKIMFIVIGILVVMFLVGLLRYGIYMSLLTSISLAVAAIPQGLPIVVTLTLALGARKLARKNALIRKLSVTESLGSVNIICTDKTGTLTRNEMEVKKVYFGDQVYADPEGIRKNANFLIRSGVLCNNSAVTYGVDDEDGQFIGDQTEVALRKIGDAIGTVKEDLEKEYVRVHELPFDSDRKMMSVIIEEEEGYTVYSKGAPEVLVERCDRILVDGVDREITQGDVSRVKEKNRSFAEEGLRVLGFAYKRVQEPEGDVSWVESELIWVGLQAMYDPPREEVKDAMEDCVSSGIRVVMITGDNPVTAQAIGKEVGILTQGTMEGKELDDMSDADLQKRLNEGINIFARTSPFHKQQILKVLQKENVVAMTGDGVNDALAMKNADVGIAMGKKGTEVTKGSSDMILLDDNFATIITAIRYGRGIFDNIKKFVNYLFTCNFAEVGVIFLSLLFFALEEPILLPVQILWINVMTDGFPAIALGMDPPSPGIMKRRPKPKGARIMDRALLLTVVGVGAVIVLSLLGVFLWGSLDGELTGRSLLFTGFVLFEFVRIASIRYQEELKFFSNPWLIAALVLSFSIQLLVVYTPINTYFSIIPIDLTGWGVLLGIGVIGFVLAVGISRWVVQRSGSEEKE